MADVSTCSIGELARLTGLSVRTIRFYSDSGVVPTAGRTSGGYRTYDVTALARLKLVRTLRELGVDLPTIQRVLASEVARRGSTNGEMELMHELARLSEQERQRILDDFLNEAFDGLDLEPRFAEKMRSVRVDLPDDPSTEQLEAWIELANLLRDEDFRASIRRMSEVHAEQRATGADMKVSEAQIQAHTFAIQQARAALDAGVAPDSPQGEEIARRVAVRWSEATGILEGAELSAWLKERDEVGGDPRAEHYWRLLAIINGWPPVPDTSAEHGWLRAAP